MSATPSTILVVEDDAIVRMLIVDVLQELEFSVLEADGSERALELLEDTARNIDLLMTDVGLPGMDGRTLAAKARDKKLTADDMQGACFTISSLGHIGGTGFTPIVNAPEVAILGVSKATIQPVWDGKAFQPKLMLPLSLSYDHRVINGAAAARFTQRLSQLLGDIRTILL